SGELYRHLAITVAEILSGIGIGALFGITIGIWLGYSRVVGTILRPIIVTFYNIPLVTLAPLFILWFGFGMESKIILISISVFFIIFFNVFSGAQKVDKDVLQGLEIMGASSREQLTKIVFPAC